MILLNPGPVTLSERVRGALTSGDWCHREPEFAELTREINAELVGIYPEMRDEFAAVTMTGSGTSAVEAMLASFAPADGSTLVVANGVYGERMARILAAYRKPHELLQLPWTSPLDMDAVLLMLDEHPDITHVATVHHETTTGRLNDIDALGALCRDRNLPMLLDGVSSFGAERIDPVGWNLDAVAGTANKCLHGVPGLSFVIGRQAIWERPRPQVGSVYLDLYGYYAGQHGDGFSPFTQSVQVAFALREAIAELQEAGGWQARRETYLQRAATIHKELGSHDVKSLLNDSEYSCVLRSYLLPANLSYATLHDDLKAQGFVIYAGQGELAEQIFRLAYMGDIRRADLDALCSALQSAISRAR
ncbi:MAG: 2-aminoethylphosphonate aminotransferase [Gammaproteobacteria bacterium]|jgi:2-aminoethylphosphonate-pyruvate transaminase|nr:2-aminoethylphosphonate aminotransferase [Gammaproteobacteria bacterium]MDH3759298.1 2-aminoethylphosphonate aminotransferase [Gammaproteobacteria bacterium]MDH3805778.1 2-aminoethylphosphonate aminotransferase [Gammaproteobacteria bacterium]